MTDAIIHTQAQSTQPDNPLHSLYNDLMHGIDKLTGKTEPEPQKEAGPLQVMPEIHGHPVDRHAGVKNKAIEGALPLPPARPPELRATPTTQELADKTLKSIAHADLSNYGQPSQEAQDVVRGFLAEKSHLADKDKPAALKHFSPGFNLAIRNADGDYIKAEKEAAPAIKTAKESYVNANSLYNSNFQDSVALAKAMPNGPEHTSAVRLLNQIGDKGAKMPNKDELTKVFNANPKVLDSLLQLIDSQQSVFKAGKDLDQATKPVMDAALEQDRARLAYERAAQSVGNKNLATSLDLERGMVDEQARAVAAPPDELRRIFKA